MGCQQYDKHSLLECMAVGLINAVQLIKICCSLCIKKILCFHSDRDLAHLERRYFSVSIAVLFTATKQVRVSWTCPVLQPRQG